MNAFTRAYLVCALWSSTDNSTPQGGEPLDANYGLEDIAPQSLAQAVADCARFQAENAADLEAVRPVLSALADDTAEARAGHDLWLNRNGHGSGFWDEVSAGHPLEAAFDRLSDAAQAMGTCDAYVGDDGAIYLS